MSEARQEHGEVDAAAPVVLKSKGDVYELEREEGIPGKQQWRRMVDAIARELLGNAAAGAEEDANAQLDV